MDKTYYRDHLVNKEHLHSKVYRGSTRYRQKSLQTVTFINWKI